MARIDFEIIPLTDSLGRRFAYDLSRLEFRQLGLQKKDWTHLLYTTAPYETTHGRRAPYIKRGAKIDEEVLAIFREQNIRFVPVLEEGGGEPVKHKLSEFSKTQTSLLIGRSFRCVQDWLRDSATSLSQNVQDVMQSRMRDLSRRLGSTFRDMQLMVQHVCTELVNQQEYLTAYALYENMLTDLRPSVAETEEEADAIEHGMQMMIAAVIVGARAGFKDNRLRQLAQAAILHDIGLIVAYESCREEMLSRRLSPAKFGEFALIIQRRHPTLGALLLTRKDGHPIAGIDPVVRAIILEHECMINGTGPALFMNKHEADLQKLGVLQETRVHGHNRLPGRVDEEHLYPMVGIEGQPAHHIRRMTMGAQLIAILERYFSQLDGRQPSDVVRSMILEAGIKINRALFDEMINAMIPLHHLPQGAIFLLRGKVGSMLEQYDRTQIMVHGQNNIDFLIMRDKNGDNIKPIPVSYEEVNKNGWLSVDTVITQQGGRRQQ